MPRKIQDILADIGYTFVSTHVENKTKFLTFICAAGHESTEVRQYFNNDKARFTKEGKNLTDMLCKKCRNSDHLTNEEFVDLMGDRFGHFDMVVVDTHHITYRCGNCGNSVPNTTKGNLLKSTGKCSNCQNINQRLSPDIVHQRLVNAGLIGLGYVYDTSRPHRDIKHIPVICPKGHSFEQTLFYLTLPTDKQRRCPDAECVRERTITTNQDRYGHDNVGQVPEFKEKGVETCMRVYGHRHSAQHPSVQAKKDQSNSAQRKKVVINGDEYSLNAHEMQAIRDILKNGLAREEDVRVGADMVPAFEYMFNGSSVSVYFPDIYLKNLDLIVEVKDLSRFTNDSNEQALSIAKCHAVRKTKPIEIWFYSRKSILEHIWEFHEDGSFSERSTFTKQVGASRTDILFQELNEKFGFTEFKYSDDSNISYICKCGSIVEHTSFGNLKKSKGFCNRCKPKLRKLTLSEIINRLEFIGVFKEGYTLDESEREHITATNIRLICPYGHRVKTSLDRLNRHQRCGAATCTEETKRRNKESSRQ